MADHANWNIPVPIPLDEALEEAVRTNNYISKSDFVREAVRRRLEQLNPKH